jgi:geranylgeranyl transferase type-2 subunit alpha
VQHGVKRVRYTKEAIEEKRKREQAKLKEYLALTEDVISRVSQDFLHGIEI